jgi:hypothetical protein
MGDPRGGAQRERACSSSARDRLAAARRGSCRIAWVLIAVGEVLRITGGSTSFVTSLRRSRDAKDQLQCMCTNGAEMAGRMINGAAALAELIRPASNTGDFGTHRVLPVLPELSSLLPSRGLRRGTTIAIGITPGPSVHQGALPTPSLPPAVPHEREDSGRAARRRSPRSASDPHEEATNGPSDRGPETDSAGSGSTNRPGGRGFAADGAGGGFADGVSSAESATSGPGGRSPNERGEKGPATGDGSANSLGGRGSTSGDGSANGLGARGSVTAGSENAPARKGSAADRSSSLRSAPPISGAGYATIRGGGAVQPGGGSTSLLLALLAAASSAGSWCAVVGVPTLGALAAAESGIALDRLALVPDPGPEWPTVVAALIDGVDVVVVAVPGQVSASITSRLVARARQRGCVLVPYGRWDGADVTLQVTQGRWEGLGTGHGRLRQRKVTVVARGRGTAARPKEITMWMPGFAVASPHDPTPGTRSRPTAVLPAADQPSPAPSAEDRDAGSGATRSGSALLASVTPILSAASDSPASTPPRLTEEAPLAVGGYA